MKFRYFLRGLGTGIVFAAIIFVIAYRSNGRELSDDEIIRRARNLGMVEADDQVGKLLEEQNKTEQETETPQDEKRTEQTTTERSEQEDSSNHVQTTEQATTTEQQEETAEEYELVVTAGMYSYPVCQKLEAFGLIESAEEFDDYLIEHGYADKISVGTHILKKGMTKEEIAIAISDS